MPLATSEWPRTHTHRPTESVLVPAFFFTWFYFSENDIVHVRMDLEGTDRGHERERGVWSAATATLPRAGDTDATVEKKTRGMAKFVQGGPFFFSSCVLGGSRSHWMKLIRHRDWCGRFDKTDTRCGVIFSGMSVEKLILLEFVMVSEPRGTGSTMTGNANLSNDENCMRS